MESISVTCKKCSTEYRLKSENAGKSFRCKKCEQIVAIPSKDTSRTTKAKKHLTVEQRVEEILARFTGDIEPVRVPFSYQLGVALVSFVMLLLPMVYLAFVVLIGYGVYYHFVNHTGMLDHGTGRGRLVVLLIYVAPGLIGAVSILFMIKPIFARPAKSQRARSLTESGEPILFAFVERICDAVGAPLPKKINVDNEVNASAGFRRGFMSMLIGNDLVLTIGMPLVSGLSVQQLAGVLAHEFGHFSQGVGMRLTYLIRSISYWFARVVYERDEWDEWLTESTEGMDFRIAILFYAAQAMVFLTRKLLWVLMICGQAVAGFLLRQMEFDADRYEARLVGSETFAATARRLTELNVGNQGAGYAIDQNMREGRLLDDLPKLTLMHTDQLSDETKRQIRERTEKAETGWLDTHPCDNERIESANREEAEGVFADSRPASVLFVHFEKICKNVTLDVYHSAFGRAIKQDELHSTDAQLKMAAAERESYDDVDEFYLGNFQAFRPVPLQSIFFEKEPITKKDVAKLKAILENLNSIRQAYSDGCEEYHSIANLYDQSEAALKLHRADSFDRKIEFIADFSNVDTANQTRRKAKAKLESIRSRLEEFEKLMGERMFLTFRILHAPNFVEKCPEADALQTETEEMCEVLSAIRRVSANVTELQHHLGGFTIMLKQASVYGRSEEFVGELFSVARTASKLLNQIREVLRVVEYPFEHAKGQMSSSQFLMGEPCSEDDIGGIYGSSESLLDEFPRFHGRVAAALVKVSKLVEAKLGVSPADS